MTPLRNPNTPAEERYNNAQKSVRSIVERCNGLLKNRFRCLLKDRVLHYSPQMAAKIVNACVVLHNMCVNNNIPEPDMADINDVDFGLGNDHFNENVGGINPDLAAGRRLQRRIIENHFL